MKFTIKDCVTPSFEFCSYFDSWIFSQDLGQFFPEADNNIITAELIRRGVVNEIFCDPEYCCSYFYFQTKKQTQEFLRRLNNQPEIANWVPPAKLGPEVIAMSHNDFATLGKFFKENLTEEQQNILKNLDIKYIDVVLPEPILVKN